MIPGFNAAATLRPALAGHLGATGFDALDAGVQPADRVTIPQRLLLYYLIIRAAQPYACFAGCSYAGGSDTECNNLCGTSY